MTTTKSRTPCAGGAGRTAGATLLLAATLLALVACSSEAPPEETLPSVVVVPVESRDLEDRIEANGSLIARQQAWVAAEVAGRITEIVQDEGADVEQGQVVLTIDPERRRLEAVDARAGVAQAEASAAESEREAVRIRQLFEKGVASKARLEQVETELRLAKSRREAARARLGMAERALADAEVRAPFAGVVAERRISVGEFVQPGTPLFELVALDPIDAEFSLPEADASRVAFGQQVSVKVAPWPERVFPAAVRFVAPTVDPETHTLLVRAALDNAERKLRPGLFASVDLGVADRKGVLLIPEEAVLQRADGEVAFRVAGDGTARRVAVETGDHLAGMVEVRSGLAMGDRVVVRGHYSLVDGARVQLRTPDGKPAGDLAANEAAAEERP
jgi:membrane fusion protein (multidrug efflux system)